MDRRISGEDRNQSLALITINHRSLEFDLPLPQLFLVLPLDMGHWDTVDFRHSHIPTLVLCKATGDPRGTEYFDIARTVHLF